MDQETKHLYLEKRMQRLMKALLVSLAVNLFLCVLCVYEWQEGGYALLTQADYKPVQAILIPQESTTYNMERLLEELQEGQSTQELISLLDDSSLVQDGYTKRDLVVALLGSVRHIDIGRVWHGSLTPTQERKLKVGDREMKLYPGLQEAHFVALKAFIKEEQYPFTAEGLFLQLQEEKEIAGESLKAAFALTKEYITAETLLSRGSRLSRDEVLGCITAGSFSQLREFVLEETKGGDFSKEKRKQLLCAYLHNNSKIAARLLVQSEQEFAIHKVSDQEAIALLHLLEDEPAIASEYALALLESQRKNEVWEAASLTLMKQVDTKEIPPSKDSAGGSTMLLSRRELLQRFGRGKMLPVEEKTEQAKEDRKNKEKSAAKPVVKTTPPPAKKQVITVKPSSTTAPSASKVPSSKGQPRLYVVQKGDTLWKISRKFKVNVAKIRQINQLESDALKPGSVLHIP